MTDQPDAQDDSLPLPVLERIDRVCLEFEAAWMAGRAPRIEDYLGETEGSERRELFRELLLLELDYRSRREQQPTPDEYQARFPHDSRLVGEVFERLTTAPAAPDTLPNQPDCFCPHMTLPAAFGDYELLEVLGEGGMGVVYRARQRTLDRVVAVKIIRPDRTAATVPARRQEVMGRFRAEIQAAARLEHEHIVPVYEVGQIEGQPFFSMRYIEGRGLDSVLHKGPLGGREAAAMVEKIARAVHHAHVHQVIHRDLKPRNILLDGESRPYVADFGLAKSLEAAQELTQTGQVIGTPAYMSPEQARGMTTVDHASDVYSLGATFYELLTARPPFRAATPAETQRQVIDNDPAPPRELNPAVPRDLETICLKCLEKDPRSRYATAEEVADELARFLARRAIRARPIGRPQRFWRWCRRNPLDAGLVAATVISLLIGVLVSGYFAFHAAEHARTAGEQARVAADKLWDAYFAEARARRFSRRPGQRFESLKALQAAVAIRPSAKLRDEAIACMTLTDLRVSREWPIRLESKVEFAPRNSWYAFDHSGAVTVRRVADNEQVASLGPVAGCEVQSMTFSSGEDLLAVVYRPTEKPAPRRDCRVWNLPTGRVICEVEDVGDLVPKFTVDDRLLAVGSPGATIRLLDVAENAITRTLESEAKVNRLLFSPDGEHFAAFSYRGSAVAIHSLENSSRTARFRLPSGVFYAAFHPRRPLLAFACRDFKVYLCDLPTGRVRRTLSGHQSEAIGVAFSVHGEVLASRSWDGTVRLWNPMTGKELVQVEATPRHLAFSHDDRRLFVRSRKKLVVYDVALPMGRTLYELPTRFKGPYGMGFSPDGRLLASASESGVYLWDTGSGREIQSLPLESAESAFFGLSGSFLFTCGKTGLRRWPVVADQDSTRVRVGDAKLLCGSKDGVSGSACLSLDGTTLASIHDSGQVVVQKLGGGKRRELPYGEPKGVVLAVSPNGKWVAAGTWLGKGVVVWDAPSGERATELLPNAPKTRAAFSPDGRWLVASAVDRVEIFEVGTWRRHRRIGREPQNMVIHLAFSRDSRLLAATSTRREVTLYETTQWSPVAKLESSEPFSLHGLCFSSDGRQLAAGGVGRIQLWNLQAIRRRLADMGLHCDLTPHRP